MSILAVSNKWAPVRKLTDEELLNARKMFHEIDSDGSGSIELEELLGAETYQQLLAETED